MIQATKFVAVHVALEKLIHAYLYQALFWIPLKTISTCYVILWKKQKHKSNNDKPSNLCGFILQDLLFTYVNHPGKCPVCNDESI